jgi:polyferredoxin
MGVRGLRRFGVWRLFNAVMRVVSSLVGLLMVLMGGVWILQGLNLAWGSLSRSFMQGDQHWAFYGTILLLVGVAQVVWSNMRQAVDSGR